MNHIVSMPLWELLVTILSAVVIGAYINNIVRTIRGEK